MDRTLAQARKEANSWTLAGLLSAGAGLSVWALNPASWVVWLCSGAFVMVGLYLVKSSRPFLAAVEQLLQTDQPCQMDLSQRAGTIHRPELLRRAAIPSELSFTLLGYSLVCLVPALA